MAKGHDYGLSKGSKNNSSYAGLSKGSKPGGGNNSFQRNNSPANNRQGGYGGGYSGGRNNGFQSTNRSNDNYGDARAPYNFIKLNDKVVQPPIAAKLSKDDRGGYSTSYSDYIINEGKYSGYFEIEVTNKTPLYIGGANGFFSDGKNICIPGSSMRGCIKNIFKIVTSSAFRCDNDNPDIKDKHLYFRSFTSRFKPFKKAYDDRMISQETFVDKNGKTQSIGKSQAKAGFIVKEDNKYYVCPCEFRAVKGFGDGKVIWKNDCVEVYSGRMMSKKHFYRLYAPHWNTKLAISDDVINDYKDDATRKGANVLADKSRRDNNYQILNGAEKYSYICPCFYVADSNGDVAHFGANPYYRIPYLKSTGDHIPAPIKDTEVVDFTDAVFGRKEDWASRIAFDDLYLDKAPDMLNASYHKILSTPNPTSFQFYLEKNAGTNQANIWESEANLRGYKLYWHTMMDWTDSTANDKMSKRIAPLKHGHTFKGKVRFENLDAEELGALCYVFALAQEKDICLKLGMGKPIGMGSIKVAAKLMLKGEDYYDSLFDTDTFAIGTQEADLNVQKAVFDNYMKTKLDGKSLALYTERMRELRMIMSMANINNPQWNKTVEKLDFLGKGEDKNIANVKKPLPSITEVFNKVKR